MCDATIGGASASVAAMSAVAMSGQTIAAMQTRLAVTVAASIGALTALMVADAAPRRNSGVVASCAKLRQVGRSDAIESQGAALMRMRGRTVADGALRCQRRASRSASTNA